MKATINGITVDGTPQEIAEYHRLLTKRAEGTSLACESVRTSEWYPYQPVGPNIAGSGLVSDVAGKRKNDLGFGDMKTSLEKMVASSKELGELLKTITFRG